MEDESNLVKEYVLESKLEEYLVLFILSFDDFDLNELGL